MLSGAGRAALARRAMIAYMARECVDGASRPSDRPRHARCTSTQYKHRQVSRITHGRCKRLGVRCAL